MNNHPDAEALSAFLDGEAPEVETHVAACAECRQQLDALARVRSAVAVPVSPPDAARRDGAIAAALDAASSGPRSTASGRWKVVGVAGAVAAAIVIGVVVTRASTSNKSATTALGKAGPVSATLVRAGDLGNVDDTLVLRAKIQPGLPAPAAASERAAQNATAGQGGAAGGGATAGQQIGPRATHSTSAAQAPKCEAAARGLQPQGAVLVYEATVRWQGTPADVFGFNPPGPPATSAPGRPAPTRVYVLARSDCHLLVFQSFAP